MATLADVHRPHEFAPSFGAFARLARRRPPSVPRAIARFVRRELGRRRLALRMCVALGLCAPEAAPDADADANVDAERCARSHAHWQQVRLEDYAEHDRRKRVRDFFLKAELRELAGSRPLSLAKLRRASSWLPRTAPGVVH